MKLRFNKNGEMGVGKIIGVLIFVVIALALRPLGNTYCPSNCQRSYQVSMREPTPRLARPMPLCPSYPCST